MRYSRGSGHVSWSFWVRFYFVFLCVDHRARPVTNARKLAHTASSGHAMKIESAAVSRRSVWRGLGIVGMLYAA
jgi:hypothetical protein